MKVLVLGGAGYIGSVLCEYLIERGDEVIVMDNLLFETGKKITIPGEFILSGKNHVKNSKFGRGVKAESSEKEDSTDISPWKFIFGDVRNLGDLIGATEMADAVVNLAAISNDPASDLQPELTWDINYKSNETIAALCKATGKRVVFASSCSVYGFAKSGVFSEENNLNPVTLYARTKMLSEKFYQDLDVNAIILRFATVYGNSQKPRFDLVVNTMIGTSYFQGKIVVNGGNQWRPIIHIKDVAKAIHLSLHAKKPKSRIYNVGSNNQNYQIKTLGEIIAKEIPGVELINQTNSIDTRSYKVNFAKIAKELNFKCDYKVKDAVKELYVSFNNGLIKNMEEDEYFRVKYLKKQMYKESYREKIMPTPTLLKIRI